MEIKTGVYTPKVEKRVTVWPKPDANGDGPELYADRIDAVGNVLGRDLVRDGNGNAVHEYNPPEGFSHVVTRSPGSNNETGAYVRLDGRGNVIRDVNGQAVGIIPGSALVENPDGTSQLLLDDFAHVLFVKSHNVLVASEPAIPAAPAAPAPPPAQTVVTPSWPPAQGG